MKTGKILLYSLLMLACFSGYLSAADSVKIGVVDFQKIVGESEAGKAAMADMNKEVKKLEAQLEEKRSSLKDLQEKIGREALVMSEEQKALNEEDYKKRVKEIRAIEGESVNRIKQLNMRLMTGLQQEVLNLVEGIGRSEGFTMIVAKREGGIMYSVDSIDITDRVIKKYDADYEKKAE